MKARNRLSGLGSLVLGVFFVSPGAASVGQDGAAASTTAPTRTIAPSPRAATAGATQTTSTTHMGFGKKIRCIVGQAAAFTTILSEAVLFVPFAWLLRSSLGDLPWAGILWRPLAATACMIGAALLVAPAHSLLAAVIGSVVYAAAWWLLRALSAEEWALLAPLLPGRLRARFIRTA